MNGRFRNGGRRLTQRQQNLVLAELIDSGCELPAIAIEQRDRVTYASAKHPAEVLSGVALKRDAGTRGEWLFGEESRCSQSVTSGRRRSVRRLRPTTE